MKIAFLTDTIFLHGGVARVVTTVANELSKSHQVDIICTYTKIPQNYDLYKLDKKKVNLIYKNIPYSISNKIIRKSIKKIRVFDKLIDNNIYMKLRFPKNMRLKLSSFLNNKNYDVVIGVHGFYSMLLGSIANSLNCKTIGWQHNSYDAYFGKKNKYFWKKEEIFKLLLSNLDGNIVLTKHDKFQYENNLGINSYVIYNPRSFVSNIKSKLYKKNILAIGRLTKQKGFDNLIKAFKIATANLKEWNLEIVGEGEESLYLKKLISELELDDIVKIRGFTNNIQEYLSRASIYAMSSNWEGFGLVVTEALEFGLPVVSFKTTGPFEILNGYNCGKIVEIGDINGFALSLKELMVDYELRKNLSRNAIKRADDFSIEKIGAIWNSFLYKVLN
ncbi:glycosyltransferase family 4 protein [Clostridium perfringens]